MTNGSEKIKNPTGRSCEIRRGPFPSISSPSWSQVLAPFFSLFSSMPSPNTFSAVCCSFLFYAASSSLQTRLKLQHVWHVFWFSPSCFLPFHGHLRCTKLLLTQITNKYLSSHLHGEIKIGTYSCHMKIARVDGAWCNVGWDFFKKPFFRNGGPYLHIFLKQKHVIIQEMVFECFLPLKT